MSNPILNTILDYKGNVVSSQRFTIPVLNRDGEHLGLLATMDRGLCEDINLIRSLTAWRQRYMDFFLTQFNATDGRTQSWLKNIVIPSPDRIFFIIYLLTGEAIGNFGVCNMTATTGELDNLIRGEEGGDPKLIYHCELALLSWMFGKLGHQTSTLHVFSNNSKTIKLHSSVGFSIVNSIRLSKKLVPGLIQYLLESVDGDPVDFSYLEMKIEKNFFLNMYPWIKHVYEDHWQ